MSFKAHSLELAKRGVTRRIGDRDPVVQLEIQLELVEGELRRFHAIAPESQVEIDFRKRLEIDPGRGDQARNLLRRLLGHLLLGLLCLRSRYQVFGEEPIGSKVGGDQRARAGQVRAELPGQIALADAGLHVVQLPYLALAAQPARCLKRRQLRNVDAELPQELGRIGAVRIELEVQPPEALRLVDAAERGDPGLPGVDPRVDAVGDLRPLAALDRRRLDLQRDRLAFDLARGRDRRPADGAARQLGQGRGDGSAAAVIPIGDRAVAQLKAADLRNRRRALRRLARLHLPVGRAVRLRFEARRRLGDDHLGQLEAAPQQRRQVDDGLGSRHRDHRRVARPGRIREPRVLDRDPGPEPHVDVEVARDLDLAPERRRGLVLDQTLEPVPVEQDHQDDQNRRKRCQGQKIHLRRLVIEWPSSAQVGGAPTTLGCNVALRPGFHPHPCRPHQWGGSGGKSEHRERWHQPGL